MTNASAERTESSRLPSDPLFQFRDRLKWEQNRYRDIPIGDYIEGVFKGVFPIPPRNAAELLVKALTVIPPTRNHEAGYTEYPVFSERTDELAIKGIPRTIDALMRFLIAEARLNSKDKGVLLVTPTGGGKSTMIGIPLLELERYTDHTEPAPVYGIKDCPINEEPLNVLSVVDEETKRKWKETYGISIPGQLCPDCKVKSEDKVRKSPLGFSQGNSIPLDFQVHALPFSVAQGRGISRLESSVTKYSNPAGLTSRIILGSNRGILHLPELMEHPIDFLRTLNDFLRGRQYSDQGRAFKLDTVVIADMTLPQWEEFKQSPANRNLLERLEVIISTYPLDSDSEREIMEKRLRSGGIAPSGLPHLSPKVLESAAEVSVRSRYRTPERSEFLGISEAEKSLLYRGLPVIPFSQDDRKRIEAEGRTVGEGEVGISPPAAWGVLYKLIAEEMPSDEEGKEPGCIDFVELRKRYEAYIMDDANLNEDGDTDHVLQQLEDVAREYDEWLLETMEQAFQDNFSERSGEILKEYLENAEPFLNGEDKIDPNTNERVRPDEKMMSEFEDALGKDTITFVENDEGVPRNGRHTTTTRKRFRFELLTKAGRITIQKQKPLESSDFPEYQEGFKRYMEREWSAKKIPPPVEILSHPKPQDAAAAELEAMKKRLVETYGFCT